MPRAAVLGMPIAHSLSPVLHLAAYDALGLADWRYQPIECDEHRLRPFLAALDEEWVGFSVTMPLKRLVLELADEVTSLAAAVGAANTLVRRDVGWHADNTDVGGMVTTLREAGVTDVSGAVVLGAGGTAQTALAALAALGETAPTVAVRDPGRTDSLRAAASRLGVTLRLVDGIAHPSVYSAPLVISTLPNGAANVLADRPQWSGAGAYFDVAYDPWPTPAAVSAAAAGWRIVSGLEMLLHQAVGQVELMTGCRPGPTEAMRQALYAETDPR